ncbi:hypothetical protein SKAU_G00317640 [Synaphobranchus kaupii]|uniref:Uncharacterized protein n=1 Tax=Synaphobranchus kaupii TaxID=118154 RepID=A0A9Q1ESX3_SYNKA|nr:hypothetical protein SKAU_G00317640 [Synaphobranchus kaupii]
MALWLVSFFRALSSEMGGDVPESAERAGMTALSTAGDSPHSAAPSDPPHPGENGSARPEEAPRVEHKYQSGRTAYATTHDLQEMLRCSLQRGGGANGIGVTPAHSAGA